MKVLVFAHTPPPHHGQSYMVQIMLENIPTKGPSGREIIFYHVNARLSDGMDDIGSWRWGKFFLLVRYVLQAWWLRWKYAPDAFYYVPAPAKRSAIYRDWFVLLLAAPLFKFRIFHWHASGLGQWLREGTQYERMRRFQTRWETEITRRVYSENDLSLVLNEQGSDDVEIFRPRHIAVVANGIPDPCPDFDSTVLPERLRRWSSRAGAKQDRLACFELLYLAHATRTKGLFDAIDAVALANAALRKENGKIQIRLTVAGAFLDSEEESTFRARLQSDDLTFATSSPGNRAVVYAGYADPQEKDRLLRNSDALCFASYFPNEVQPVSVIEALAYGMPVVLSRWKGLPEMVPAPLAYVAEPRDPAALAKTLRLIVVEKRFKEYRRCYVERYSLAAHCKSLRKAFLSVGSEPNRDGEAT